MDQTNRVQEYFDVRADFYLRRSHGGLWYLFRRREYASVARLLNLKQGARVLDVGCGAGYYALRLRDEFGAEITGIDLSEKMIAQLSIHGICGRVGDMATFEGSEEFDRILMAGMLEFVPDPEVVFRAAYRALKPGGVVVALIPKAGPSGWAYALVHELSGCPTRIMSSESYKRLAAQVGFRFVESESCTPISMAISWVK